MVHKRLLLVGLLVGFLGITTILAGSSPPSGEITVGDFVVQVAQRMNAENGHDSLTPEMASDLLKKRGLSIRADLNSPLTEKDASDLFGQLGIELRTEHPLDLLDAQRAANIIGIFGDSLASKVAPSRFSFSQNGDVSVDHGEPPPPLPSNIVDCQMRGNSAACFLCCVRELDVPWWRCIVPCLPKNLISPDCPH